MRWELLTVLFLYVGPSSQIDPLMEHCYQKDEVPVDLDLVFDSNCEDNQGNIYRPNSTLQSCCDCFSYKCSQRSSWDLRVKVGWVRTVSSLCCQTCNGTVVPANTFISSSSLQDRCLTVRTEVCRLRPGMRMAFIEEEFSYKNCCHDNNRKSRF